ncbi:MAG TPA: hypothetical protein VJH92_02195 [Candidatus Nanoarchaeia archaeon]|nr:hypothetical protein [Candidatus Nanoarchaeia archaeon]
MKRSEYKEKLVEYFKKNLNKGYTEDSLKFALIKQGYSRVVVEEALRDVHLDLASKAPVLADKPEIKYEVLDENDNVVKRPWWKKLFGL